MLFYVYGCVHVFISLNMYFLLEVFLKYLLLKIRYQCIILLFKKYIYTLITMTQNKTIKIVKFE